MPLARVNGVTLHTHVLGDGLPLAMLHGLFVGSLASWYFTAAPVLSRSHRVLLYDLRGHGKSERALKGYDLATLAADLEGLLERFHAGPLSLVGHSYGALVALRFALDRPERVRRLALVEAPLPPSRLAEMRAFQERTPEQMADALPAAMRRTLARDGRQAARLLASLGFLISESSLLADMVAEPDLPDASLAALACPVLCVYGTESSCRDVGTRLERVIPGARLVFLKGGHFLHLDAPSALAGCLEEFLGG
jgi:pimeloyl-ACP methyl ester carboxylesterase